MKIDDLKPASYNPRTMKESAQKGLENSLSRFGDISGITWNKKTGNLVTGHQRVSRLKKLGATFQDGVLSLKDKIFNIRIVEWDIETEKAANITANNPHIMGEFDDDSLKKLIHELETIDVSQYNIDSLLSELEEEKTESDDRFNRIKKDKINKEQPYEYQQDTSEVKTEVKVNELYELGNHFLFCGDSIDINNINRLIGNNKIDILFTDPPYGIEIVNKGTKKVGGNGKIYQEIIGDDSVETAKACYEISCKLEIPIKIIWGGNYFTDFLPPSPCWIVWDKQNTGHFADVELAWCNLERSAKLYHWLWNGLCRHGERKSELISRIHPTQKPVGLFVEILKEFDGNTVLDPFGGSGSTLIACQILNKQCFIAEMSEHYCEMIIKRWEDYTGERAYKLL
jgi:DNA modification methylase